MRNKRLRKKLYVDEFAVYGFEFTADCTKQKDNSRFWNDFICLIESRGLIVGGAVNLEEFDGFIVANKRYSSPTNEDRQAVKEWLINHCENSQVTEMVNAHYPD